MEKDTGQTATIPISVDAVVALCEEEGWVERGEKMDHHFINYVLRQAQEARLNGGLKGDLTVGEIRVYRDEYLEDLEKNNGWAD